ncbi:hypothetical protein EPN96_02150 [bacterium]|nr:MAG: hypothetical protein EPN96_02150 [bacterium]
MKIRLNALGGVALFALFLTLPASFAAGAETKEKPATEQVNIEEGQKIQVQMQDVEIRGELERPEVFYIIPRRKARMDLGALRKSFEEEIMKPLLPEPFEATYGGKKGETE